ncbi:hypothetical protein G9A89_004367 [Geosiphon pyriformis]|nr:hypothetical protein G9A89_004367 [Geosiphon pyriformis]
MAKRDDDAIAEELFSHVLRSTNAANTRPHLVNFTTTVAKLGHVPEINLSKAK